MTKDKYFELQGRDIFLRPVRINSSEVINTVRHPLVILFAGLLVLTLVIFDAANLLAYMSWWQAFLIWVIAVSVQIIAYSGLSLLWGRAQSRGQAPVVILPLVGLLSYLLTYSTTIFLVQMTTGRSWDAVFVPQVLLTGYVFAIIGEAIYFAFVLPQLLQDIRSDDQPDTARSISIAGQKFALNTVLTLRGQEHYVLVQTADDTHKLRGRLSDLVSQTDEPDGVLAHRSYWISGQAITRLERAGNTDVIVTALGERLKVAQPRRIEVRSWVAQYAPGAVDTATNQTT